MRTKQLNAASLVDAQRYPIEHADASAYATIVAAARTQIAREGYAEIPRFLSDVGLERCLADARSLVSRAYVSRGRGTAYLEEPGDAWPSEHARAQRRPYAVGVVAYDQFPITSAIRTLYEWPALMRFVAATLGLDAIHRYADPLGALNLAVMTEGDELQWHYDQTDFVVSLALQSAAQGGDFEVVPNLRTSREERYERVRAVLDGDRTQVTRLAMTPGTLLVFAGRNSLHRVSPIQGDVARLVALFGYDANAGVRSTPHLQLKRYGRVKA